MSKINYFIREVLHYASQLDPQEWVIVLCVLIIIGALCLRGFGSRSDY
ncbi:MAG: hypothetical protein ACWGMZ_06435 [Thermoguttaceae bacterium]